MNTTPEINNEKKLVEALRQQCLNGDIKKGLELTQEQINDLMSE